MVVLVRNEHFETHESGDAIFTILALFKKTLGKNLQSLVINWSSAVIVMVTPSLPQRGRHSKGSTPLIPISEILIERLN